MLLKSILVSICIYIHIVLIILSYSLPIDFAGTEIDLSVKILLVLFNVTVVMIAVRLRKDGLAVLLLFVNTVCMSFFLFLAYMAFFSESGWHGLKVLDIVK